MIDSPSLPWYRQLTGYHWFVFLVASAAWFFDCMDQRLFSLSRIDALKSLVPEGTKPETIPDLAKQVTAWFLVGWGVGGVLFGALGDRYGRAKMLSITVLIYSICTGANYFSRTPFDFALFRFLTGVGIGGVFGLSVALIAETVPDGARAPALGMLQILSTIGNIGAGLAYNLIANLEASKAIETNQGWRYLYLIGALPALMVIFIQGKLREPAPWLHAKEAGLLPKGGLLAPYVNLLSDARWRKNLIIGCVLASAGVVGLWAIGEYAPDLQNRVFTTYYKEQGLSDEAVATAMKTTKGWVYIVQMIGAGVGMWLFAKLATKTGRRMAFFIGFLAALVITVYAYATLNTPQQAYILMPLMSAAQLSVFAGFAIYLPELFPSRLRSTGTSFCYNLGRFAAAAGSLFSAQIASGLYGEYGSPTKERYAAITMCAIFLAGLAVLPFAPETKGKPLPE